MLPSGADTVLVRHSELGIKSNQVQHRMERLLCRNIERMLADRRISGTVTREHGRLYIRTDRDAVDAATEVATDTMGVSAASPVVRTEPTMDAIRTTLATVAAEVHPGGSFAVRARRAGGLDAHPFTSQDIDREGGSAIWDVLDDPAVDLDDPAMTYFVECRGDEAFVFVEKRDGPGGFPYRSQGRVLALVSGGIDSPVAAWEILRRGCEIVAVYYDFEEYGGADHVARAFESVRHLAQYVPGGSIDLYRVPAGEVGAFLVEATGPTRMLSLRRFMFAGAEQIADRVEADAIATGEALGQKSSQTGPNLSLTGAHVRYPIHRPLLGLDKQEIIDRAKRLGTFEDASIDAGCNRLAPSHPETAGTLAQVQAAEPDGFFAAIRDAIDRSERVTLECHDIDRPAARPKGQP